MTTMNTALPSALRPPAALPVAAMITDAEFALYQALLRRETGLAFGPGRRAWLVARLHSRVRQLRLRSFSEYYRVARYDKDERTVMIDLLAPGDTAFFREPVQFVRLEQKLVPSWKRAAEAGTRARSVRVWSAGCGSGEEAYSVAMVLDTLLEGWDIEILATDISSRALARAIEGAWPLEKAMQIPDRYRRRSMQERGGKMRIADEIRKHVRFSRHNLHDAAADPGGPFDLILCRNVLAHFAESARSAALLRLIASCNRGGHLFLGHTDPMAEIPAGVKVVEPAIWQRK